MTKFRSVVVTYKFLVDSDKKKCNENVRTVVVSKEERKTYCTNKNKFFLSYSQAGVSVSLTVRLSHRMNCNNSQGLLKIANYD